MLCPASKNVPVIIAAANAINKTAVNLVEKRKLEINDLISQKNTEVAGLQSQINTAITNYDTQITAKRNEIAVLEADIKKLSIT